MEKNNCLNYQTCHTCKKKVKINEIYCKLSKFTFCSKECFEFI